MQKKQYIERERFAKIMQEMQVGDKLLYAGALLRRAAEKFPTNTALICKGVSITYRKLYARAHAFGQYLKTLDVKPGDRVCLWFENSIEFYVAYYGSWQIGAVIIPLNTFFHSKELEHVLIDAQPKVLILSDSLAHFLADVDPQRIPTLVKEKELADTVAHQDDMQLYAVEELPADHMSVLLYTSGTTGVPKGVMLSSRNILTNVAQVITPVEVSSSDCLYGLLPLFHSFAQNTCVWSPFFVGASIVLIPRIERRWILEGLVHKPTVLAGVPALYGLLCLMKTAPVDSIRYFICGGDALPDKIRAGFELLYRRKIVNGYGLTETAPFIAVALEDELMQTNTIGYPAVGVQVSLRDENEQEVAPGKIGVLWVKGDNIMLGYYNHPVETKAVLKDGWLNTGDFVSLDHKGRLIIAGREKDLIIHKGFNIYPQEIENVLLSHPLVFKAGVVGIQDPDVGEVPIAFVAVQQKQEGLERALKDLCARNLATYKVPRTYVIREDLPMTALGKIDKKKLRAEYEQQD